MDKLSSRNLLKDVYSDKSVQLLASQIKAVYSNFDGQKFKEKFSAEHPELEFSQRISLIVQLLREYLPSEPSISIPILVQALGPSLPNPGRFDTESFIYLPLTHYVAKYGLSYIDLSLSALKEMTSRFSSEFAISAFLETDFDRAYEVLQDWTQDPDPHVRRLVSEGTRCRLPMGKRLNVFKGRQGKLISLLEKLKNDSHEYVRLSVANNINDLSKEEPNLVKELIREWLKVENNNLYKLAKHASRTLIKNADPDILSLFGYSGNGSVSLTNYELQTDTVIVGQELEFEIEVESQIVTKALIEYIIISPGKRNSRRRIYRLRDCLIRPNKRKFIKKVHKIKNTSSFNWLRGSSSLVIRINGVEIAEREFQLVM